MTLTTKEMYNVIKPKRSKKKTIIIIIIAVIVLAFIAWIIYNAKFKKVEISYDTSAPTIGDVTSVISASGTISATNEVEVGSQVSGTITTVNVDVNDRVKMGQVLAIINPDTIYQTIDRYKAQVNSAKASLKSAEVTLANKQWNYDKYKKLYAATNGKSPSQMDMESAKLALDTALADVAVRQASIMEAETNLKSAQIDLKNSIIVSPIDGVILERAIEPGQTVAASFNTPKLFLVAENLEQMKLVINVSEADVGRVKEGQKVTFSVDAYPDNSFHSTVYRVNVGSTKSTDNIVSYETTIYVENPEFFLRSGMNATADIETASAKNVMLVPSPALYFSMDHLQSGTKKPQAGMFGANMGRKKYEMADTVKKSSKTGTLWVLENGAPQKIDVEVGVSDGKMTQVISDKINESSFIITSATLKK